MPLRERLSALAGAAIALSLAACGSSNSPAPLPGSPVPAPPPTDSPQTPGRVEANPPGDITWSPRLTNVLGTNHAEVSNGISSDDGRHQYSDAASNVHAENQSPENDPAADLMTLDSRNGYDAQLTLFPTAVGNPVVLQVGDIRYTPGSDHSREVMSIEAVGTEGTLKMYTNRDGTHASFEPRNGATVQGTPTDGGRRLPDNAGPPIRDTESSNVQMYLGPANTCLSVGQATWKFDARLGGVERIQITSQGGALTTFRNAAMAAPGRLTMTSVGGPDCLA